MKILNHIHEISCGDKPAVFTIGNFDGLHLGHQALISRLITKARKREGLSYLLTFQNHPSTILKPSFKVLNLITSEHKIKLLEELGVDNLILIPFTVEFSEQTAQLFLENFHHHLKFTDLILGYDAVVGKARQGDRSTLEEIAKKLNFQVEYLSPIYIEGTPVSSSQIRKMLQEGNLKEAEKLLGRPYSIYTEVIFGNSQGQRIGFPTANLKVDGLCLPPLGVYAVKVRFEGQEIIGAANLGIAPSLRNDGTPLLEVHLLDNSSNLYGKKIEVIFQKFLRKEIKFESLTALKAQIAKDVADIRILNA